MEFNAQRQPVVSKNIVILSDGTGQAGGLHPGRDTNVFKLFQACPVVPGVQQTFYDPGLGSGREPTERTRWRRVHDLFSRVTGLGLTRNIEDCYDALIRMYEPGDRIFLFGFSRGAYTVRSLGGVLSLCGIPARSLGGVDLHTTDRLRRWAAEVAVRYVYKRYGRDAASVARRVSRARRFRRRHHCHDVVPYFIGVWDTVRAIGLPGIGKSVIWRHAFHDSKLDPRVPYARHALSIDENRSIFAPELWEAGPDEPEGRIKQVWFPGVHSDVGGGYAETGLSDLTLDWMLNEATSIPEPLLVDRASLNLQPSHRGLQHDQRIGWGRLWAEGVRRQIHPEFVPDVPVGKRMSEENVPTVHGERPYRPAALRTHPVYKEFYSRRRR